MPDLTLRPGAWVQVGDDEHSGQVAEVTATAVTYTDSEIGEVFTVPRGIVQVVDHPDVDHAAHQILDLLRGFDPAWSQTDTWNRRRDIVRTVLRAAVPDHPAVRPKTPFHDDVRRHLLHAHGVANGLELTDARAVESHNREHAGPGTVRNHPPGDLSWPRQNTDAAPAEREEGGNV